MPTLSKARALAATLRLPNLPSVWSNTLTGAILAAVIFEAGELSHLPWALLAASCLYFAGNLFNDWADRAWDSSRRPERALPSGLFQPRQYLSMGMSLTVLGLAFAAWSSLAAFGVALALTAFIIIYTWCHKKSAWSVIPMALCRALLPVLGFTACASNLAKIRWAAAPGALLFVYLIMLSLRARSESKDQVPRHQSVITACGLMLPPIMLCAFWYLPHFWTDALLACVAASLPYLVWLALTLTIYRKPIGRQVSAMLAGIPLVDALFLLPYFIMGSMLTPGPAGTALVFSWVLAFVTGRLLQRYVPAT